MSNACRFVRALELNALIHPHHNHITVCPASFGDQLTSFHYCVALSRSVCGSRVQSRQSTITLYSTKYCKSGPPISRIHMAINDMQKGPRILNTRIVCATRFFKVEELELEFSNGVRARYERLRGVQNGLVLAVPMPDDATVLLVREFAAGTERYELGFPKGRIEPSEDKLQAANREMMEEIGYASKRLTPLHSLSLAPGYVNAVTHVVLAQQLYPKRLPGDEPEHIEIISWPLDQFEALLAHDEFSEARSIAALFLVRPACTGPKSLVRNE